MKIKDVPLELYGLDAEELSKASNSLEEPRAFFDLDDGMTCLYTDGDGGIALVSGYTGMYEERGFSVRLIDCEWCEFHYEYFKQIQEEFELNWEEASLNVDNEEE